MRIIQLSFLDMVIGATSHLYGDKITDFRTKKKVGICYAGKEGINMKEKIKEYLKCERKGVTGGCPKLS